MTDFWVQVHGLPLDRQHLLNLQRIGRIMGRVLDTDLSGSGWKRFIRVRVEMDVGKLLCTRFPMNREKLSALWILFKYEKLGNFCYGCGLLGHEVKSCKDGEVQALWKKGITIGVHGNWLRAESSEFQPGIDLEGLKYSDLAECSPVEDNNSLRNPVRNGLMELDLSLTDQALIKASEVWEKMQQRVPMDQSEN